MPAAATVQKLIDAVEAGDFLGAIRDFYTDGASMQENNDAPRVGVPALLENEQRVMTVFKTITGKSLGAPLVAGDRVAINWVFDFVRPDGSVAHLEEIAWQRWEGEKVAEERFFYDRAQLAAATSAAVPA
jgi:hypothetical protein